MHIHIHNLDACPHVATTGNIEHMIVLSLRFPLVLVGRIFRLPCPKFLEFSRHHAAVYNYPSIHLNMVWRPLPLLISVGAWYIRVLGDLVSNSSAELMWKYHQMFLSHANDHLLGIDFLKFHDTPTDEIQGWNFMHSQNTVVSSMIPSMKNDNMRPTCDWNTRSPLRSQTPRRCDYTKQCDYTGSPCYMFHNQLEIHFACITASSVGLPDQPFRDTSLTPSLPFTNEYMIIERGKLITLSGFGPV